MGNQCCSSNGISAGEYMDVSPSRVRRKLPFKSIDSKSSLSGSFVIHDDYFTANYEISNQSEMSIKEVLARKTEREPLIRCRSESDISMDSIDELHRQNKWYFINYYVNVLCAKFVTNYTRSCFM